MATRSHRTRQLSRREQTSAAIDIRIHDLIMKFLETEDATTLETLGYLRAAYAQGYTDCLKEPEGQRGKWIKELGYGVRGVEI